MEVDLETHALNPSPAIQRYLAVVGKTTLSSHFLCYGDTVWEGFDARLSWAQELRRSGGERADALLLVRDASLIREALRVELSQMRPETEHPAPSLGEHVGLDSMLHFDGGDAHTFPVAVTGEVMIPHAEVEDLEDVEDLDAEPLPVEEVTPEVADPVATSRPQPEVRDLADAAGPWVPLAMALAGLLLLAGVAIAVFAVWGG